MLAKRKLHHFHLCYGLGGAKEFYWAQSKN